MHKVFYEDCINQKYFHATSETIIETKLMHQFIADLLFKHCSFKSFTESYNFLHAIGTNYRYNLVDKRFTDLFYTYELVKFYSEHSLGPLSCILF